MIVVAQTFAYSVPDEIMYSKETCIFCIIVREEYCCCNYEYTVGGTGF